jgi:hypothetical protein
MQLHFCRMKMLFHPHMPKSFSKITQICRRLNIAIGEYPCDRNLEPFDLAIHWDYNTVCPPDETLSRIHRSLRVINLGVVDVSKSFVDTIFTQVFGYSSLIDPFQQFGFAIRKSEKQAAHDASIVPLPVITEKGFIYQKLLDSRCSPLLCSDIRVPVFKNEIPFAFLKYRQITEPVKSLAKVEFIQEPQTILSPKEIVNILKFAQAFGLDFGEIDLVRNNSDGRIYILDVNNMAGNAMFKHMPDHLIDKIMKSYTDYFHSKFIL